MIKDSSKITTEVTVTDGVPTEKVNRSYWRNVLLSNIDDSRVPEQFVGKFGRTDVSVHLDYVRLDWWYRPDWRRGGVGNAWELNTIEVVGTQIKKGGGLGEREIKRTYFDGAGPDNLPQYEAPPWLREIIEDHRPEGTSHPYAIDIDDADVEVELARWNKEDFT